MNQVSESRCFVVIQSSAALYPNLPPEGDAAAPGAMNLDEDARWLEWVTKQFESIAGEDKEIDLDEFKTALKVKEVMFYLNVII